MTGRGYLTSVLNPNWAGLTRITFRSSLRKEPNTQYTVCWVDSGFGLKRLIGAIGVEGELTQQSAEIPVDYEIDVYGLLKTITLDEGIGEPITTTSPLTVVVTPVSSSSKE